ncbi:phosphatidylinositol-binding clathrin assembly protein isoform X2 [Triplophysa dalaica]|uniref:phosphatidylinositol-binding clathrin assembly protein isoform X2 n=1 Tax=Triplophysa dalaica TaxID=1582913 RepID=UPI0024DF9237|nr:phosphatidylinositol-binding clathrin assembly protein isoform X2 [Triplophysa dalaica]
MSGQSITDRIAAAQHSMTGSAISKAVCKATTHEVSGPKKKHIDYLIHCTNEMNVNVPQLADTLFERTANSSWVVVFKSLITTHHLMMYGNERFIQYLASRNTLFNLSNFLDKGALQGYDMSKFIRRYSRYLNEKALSYRLVAVDFTKMKRGVDGVMRTMNTEKLIKTLPIIQNQLDALLDFQASPNELTNGVINAAFMLLFKDSIRLFAAYNEGVINLLEKYFDMKKNQCKDALDIYKKFLYRMTKLSEFLKVAEAPSSLLEALEQHLASLEGKKTKELSADNRANTLSSAVSSLSNTGMSFSRMDEKEKQLALEEEQARLQALKDQRLKEMGIQTPSASPSTQSMGSTNNHTTGMDLFSNTTSPPSNSMPNLTSDLFDLQPAFIPAVQSTPITTNSSAWGGLESSSLHPMASMSTMNVDFDAVFGTKASDSDVKPSAGYDALGDLLKPTVTVHSHAPVMPPHTGGKLLASDLDSSLASLVGNLQFGGTPGRKSDMHWTQPGERKLTGGTNWQSKTMSNTTAWSPAPLPPAAMPPAAMPVPHMTGMFYTGYPFWSSEFLNQLRNIEGIDSYSDHLMISYLSAPATMAFPMTTPQVPVFGMVPTQLGHMGGVPMMTQQPMLYNQPVLRPNNPFTTIPGAQMQFM